MLIIFTGLFFVYQLSFKMIALSRNKIVAVSIANGEIEKIRNLPYQLIGIINGVLPVPNGVLDVTATTTMNGVQYNIQRNIKYIIDEADGTGENDECNWDYKRAEIKVSWFGKSEGEVMAVSDIAPKDAVQEIQSCQEQPGGILSVSVSDAFGNLVFSPLIQVLDPVSGEEITYASPSDGVFDFPLATSTYKIIVSKGAEYNQERTYGTEEIASPENPHLTVLEGEITETSFFIDKVSGFSVETLSLWSSSDFSDSFPNQTKISELSDTIINGGKANLASGVDGYLPSGYLISIPILPSSLTQWNEFSWSDYEPVETDLEYQIYYATGTQWELIPDSALAGNLEGFSSSPIDVSGLSPSLYSQLKLRAGFSTSDASSSPELYDWQISWLTSEPTSVPNASFNLRGEKIIGTDAEEEPVYKYSITTATDASGRKNLTGLEWDNYIFSIDPLSELDLVSINPSPQPISLLPDAEMDIKLYLDAQNSFLLTIQNYLTLEPVFSAEIRMHNVSLGYDTTLYTNEKGQTYFIPLDNALYNLEIQAPAYAGFSGSVSVSGDTTKIIKLEQIE